jgi:hypothetical protein
MNRMAQLNSAMPLLPLPGFIGDIAPLTNRFPTQLQLLQER